MPNAFQSKAVKAAGVEGGHTSALFIGRSVHVEMSCFRGGYSGELESKGAIVCLVVVARIGELVLD